MTTAPTTTLTAAGCYGDGTLGHENTRGRAADTLECYIHENFASRGLPVPDAGHATSPRDLVLSLRGEMPDDAYDEYAACDWLNEHAPFEGATWGWQDGDFGLWLTDPTEG